MIDGSRRNVDSFRYLSLIMAYGLRSEEYIYREMGKANLQAILPSTGALLPVENIRRLQPDLPAR